MTPRFNLSWPLGLVLSISLDCRAFEEGIPAKREALLKELKKQGQESGECRLQKAKTGYLAEVKFVQELGTDNGRFATSLNRPAPAEPNLRVHVLVYDYAQVPEQRLANATKRARMIFLEAQVELLLIDHTSIQKLSSKKEWDDIDLVLRILPQPRATLASQKALGEALPCDLSREGCLASVFYNRIQESSDSREISSDEILGHAIAHELGHLLLGSDSHAAKGLMKKNWDRNDFRRAAKGDLLFAPEQSKILRRNVLARIRVKKILTASPSATSTASGTVR